MDEELESRVWQRVRFELPIAEAAGCAGLLRALYKYGRGKEVSARLLQTQMEHLDTLRGIQRSLGRPEPEWVIAEPRGAGLTQVCGSALEKLRLLGRRYEVLSRDETYGPVFRLLEKENISMQKELLRLYSRV